MHGGPQPDRWRPFVVRRARSAADVPRIAAEAETWWTDRSLTVKVACRDLTASLDQGRRFTATSDCWQPCSGDRGHMTNSASRVLRAVAIAACAPYIGLKIAWMSGSHIGIPNGSTLLEDRTAMILGSAESALLDAVLIALVLLLTQRWGRRVSPWLLIPPVWAAAGLLSPIMVGYPLQLGVRMLGGTASPAGGPAARPFLHEWVFTVVYSGFIVQALALSALFVLYAGTRWGQLWRGRVSDLAAQGATRGVQRATALMASAVMLVPLGSHLLWATGSTSGLTAPQISGRTSDFYALEAAYALFAAMTVTGLLLVAFPGTASLPLRLPLSMVFVGSAALACWGAYLMVTAVQDHDPSHRISELMNVTYSMQVLAGALVFTMGAYFFTERAQRSLAEAG